MRGSVSQKDRAELEQLYLGMQSTIEHLQEAVNQDRITQTQADEHLVEIYGSDYKQIMQKAEKMLKPKKIFPVSASLLVLAAVFALSGWYLFTDGSLTASSVSDQHTKFLIVDDAPVSIPTQKSISNLSIEAHYKGPGSFTLHLNDLNGQHVLATGTSLRLECGGCDKQYKPPYMLELESGGGSLDVKDLSYKVTG